MEEKFQQIEADNAIFQNIKNINWKVDKNKIQYSQKKRIQRLKNIFKKMMFGEEILEQSQVQVQQNKEQRQSNPLRRMLTRSESQALNQEKTKNLNKLVTNSLAKDQKEPQNDFVSKINLDNFGITSEQLRELFLSLKQNKTSINQIGFYGRLLNLPQYAQEISTLKQLGLNLTCSEDCKKIQDYPENSLIISPSEEALNMNYEQIQQINENEKIKKFFIFKNSEDRFYETWKQKFVNEKFEFFSSFKKVIEQIFNYCRYNKFVSDSDQTFLILGMSLQEKKNFQCFCAKHLNNNKESGTLYCLETIFQNYQDQFSNQIKLGQEITYMNQLLTSSLDNNIKVDNIMDMFKNNSPLFQLFNTILKMNSLSFLKIVEPILNLLLSNFKIEEPIQSESKLQFYTCINAPLSLINKIKNIYIKNQCYYFSQFLYASSNREDLIKCNPNLMITISLEDDYIYKTNSLFMINENIIRPLINKIQPLKINSNVNIMNDNQNIAQNLNTNWSLEEILIPAHYPFRVKSFTMVNDIYELVLQIPNCFDYIDEHFLLFSKPLLIQDKEKNEELSEIMSQFEIQLIDEFIPLKNDNPSYFMELFFCKQLYKNYQYYKKDHFEEVVFYQNNEIIENARIQHNQYLIEEQNLKEYESIYQLCSHLKKNHFSGQINTIVFTIQIKNEPNQIIKKTYSRIYLIGTDKSFYCEEELDNVFVNCDSLMLRQFFESLINVRSIYINFNGQYIKQKQMVQNGLKLLNILKDFNHIENLYFNINENQFVLSILKSFLQKYENLRFLKILIIQIEKCQMYDSDFLNLAIINTFTQLETLSILCDQNKLTNNCISTLLTFSKIQSLKNLYLKLNDNKVDDKNLRTLKQKLQNGNLKVFVDLVN